MKWLFLFLLLLLTWVVDVYHRGVAPIPKLTEQEKNNSPVALWIPKETAGINQLVVGGTLFQIGRAAGVKTKDLLYRQEEVLINQFDAFFPSRILRQVLEVLGIRYFWGIDRFLSPWMFEEMYGVSLSVTHDFDYIGTPLTRQVIYHGLHEVGQMAVDQGTESMGCTVVALPYENSWLLGRNFDFEGGRIFDSEKIMKWVYPKKGFAYLSVIWAGMVGAVTGVNEKGVYISLNAAGTTDYARFGTPSTLVITKALMNAATAKAAAQIITEAQMFITDIFVVSDRTTGELYRIEKSPKFTEIIPLHGPSAVTNHLISPRWANDSINRHRTFDQTSLVRSKRAEKLVADYKDKLTNTKNPAEIVLKILRDKGEEDGHPLHLGNRKAIDALIATHAVVYNMPNNIFYVSQGPGLTGSFNGYNLSESFAQHRPVQTDVLPPDPQLKPAMFFDIRESSRLIEQAQGLIHKKECAKAKEILDGLQGHNHELYNFYFAMGDFYHCTHDEILAKRNWQRSLDLSPAYAGQVKYLKENLK
jgi:predicted choloylglycine hydrolase